MGLGGLGLAFEGLVEGFFILGHEENKQTQIDTDLRCFLVSYVN
jgi:hypothetical protein